MGQNRTGTTTRTLQTTQLTPLKAEVRGEVAPFSLLDIHAATLVWSDRGIHAVSAAGADFLVLALLIHLLQGSRS